MSERTSSVSRSTRARIDLAVDFIYIYKMYIYIYDDGEWPRVACFVFAIGTKCRSIAGADMIN